MNPIVILTLNNLALTKKAVASALAQDIGDVVLHVHDNGSTDGTVEWLHSFTDVVTTIMPKGISVSASWNRALHHWFRRGAKHVLVLNNDIELRPDTYRLLAEDGGGFVTAVGVRESEKIAPPYATPNPEAKRPHPDFSCYLIRKEVFEKVGDFDEKFDPAFFEDNDFHLRMHRAGIHAISLDLPFLHHGSATIKNATLAASLKLAKQAQACKEYFRSKYGFDAGTPEYYAAFGHGEPA